MAKKAFKAKKAKKEFWDFIVIFIVTLQTFT